MMFDIYVTNATEHSIFGLNGILAGLAIIVSVSLTLLTLWLNTRSDQKKKRNELDLYKQMIISSIERSKKDIEKSISVISYFSEKIKNNDSFNLENLFFVSINFSKIYSLPYEKVWNALLVNLEADNTDDISKYFDNLMTQIEFFSHFKEELIDMYKELKSDIEQLSEKWNNTLLPLSFSITDNLKIANNKEKEFYNLGKNQFLIFNENQRERIKSDNENMNPLLSDYMNICIKPLIDYYYHHPEIHESDKVDKTLQLIHILKNLHYQHAIYMKGYSSAFSKFSEKMEESKRTLIEAVNFFKSKEIKSLRKVRL